MGLRELQKTVQQVLQSAAFLLNQLDFFHRPAIAGRVGISEILGQKLHVHADGRERIFDLVSQRPGQPHNFGILIDQPAVQFVVRGHGRN